MTLKKTLKNHWDKIRDNLFFLLVDRATLAPSAITCGSDSSAPDLTAEAGEEEEEEEEEETSRATSRWRSGTEGTWVAGPQSGSLPERGSGGPPAREEASFEAT